MKQNVRQTTSDRVERFLWGAMCSGIVTVALSACRLIGVPGVPSTPNPLAYYSTRPFSGIAHVPASATGTYLVRLDRYCGTMTATECSAAD